MEPLRYLNVFVFGRTVPKFATYHHILEFGTIFVVLGFELTLFLGAKQVHCIRCNWY